MDYEKKTRISLWGTRQSKRVIDVTVSAIALIGLSPFLVILGMISLITMGRPVLFKQKRGGIHGQPFIYYKFRSMTDQRDEEGDLVPDEQRITRFGAFLRRTTLDELPSLFNVLRGDMSLVGPRPLFHHYVDLYDDEQARRLEVRPGLTSWAVIKGRNALSWEKKFEYDVWYVDNRSMWLDLKILAKTAWLVLTGKGVSQEGHVTVENFKGSSPENPNRTS